MLQFAASGLGTACRDGLTSCQEVFEADIKCSVCVRGEDCPLLAHHILRLSVLAAVRVPNLLPFPKPVSKSVPLTRHEPESHSNAAPNSTHVHVDTHAISPASTDSRRHNDQCVLGDKVPYASLAPSVV